MIVATILSLLGMAKIAAGTPRQAALIAGVGLLRPARRMLRLAGFTLLASSCAMVLTGADPARQFVSWIGTICLEALAVALLATLIAA